MKGKAKEDFKKFYTKESFKGGVSNKYEVFRSFPFSMQSGVLLEFFDSVGIKISIFHHHQGKFTFLIDNRPSYMYRDTREEALKEAFKKAEEIYNKNKDEK